MELFLDVLNTFPGEAAIETKILGLLNNIAEVWHGFSLVLSGKDYQGNSILRSSGCDLPFLSTLSLIGSGSCSTRRASRFNLF